jgi:hypothetical protein
VDDQVSLSSMIVLGLALLAMGGLPFLLWGIFMRSVIGLHATWLVNSVTHIWGSRRFSTRDTSTNNWFVALLTFGEGWYNNHHAHPTSSHHGLKWYEVDMNWYGIWALKLALMPRNPQPSPPRLRLSRQILPIALTCTVPDRGNWRWARLCEGVVGRKRAVRSRNSILILCKFPSRRCLGFRSGRGVGEASIEIDAKLVVRERIRGRGDSFLTTEGIQLALGRLHRILLEL